MIHVGYRRKHLSAKIQKRFFEMVHASFCESIGVPLHVTLWLRAHAVRNAIAIVSKAKVAPEEEMHHKGGSKYIRHVGIWLLGVSIWAVICLPSLSFAMPCKTEWVVGGW